MYGCEKGGKDQTPVYMGWPVPGSRGGLPCMDMRCLKTDLKESGSLEVEYTLS
jgi:hypothetical protein